MSEHRIGTWAAIGAIVAGLVLLGLAALAQEPANPRTPSQPQSADGSQRQAQPRQPEAQAEPRQAEPRTAQPRQPERREPPQRVEVQPRFRGLPRPYSFPPIDLRLGFYYHPYFGFYYGPYYGPYYPYPGPFRGPSRYAASAVRTRVRPVETEVYLNGYFAGIADDFDGIFQRLYIPAGQHEIELRLEGYQTFTRQIYVAPGDTFTLDHQMAPVAAGEVTPPPPVPEPVPEDWLETGDDAGENPPASPYGMLALRVEPPDAQILIDDEGWAPVPGQAELVLHLPAGWHKLEVRAEGYRRFATELQLSEGETTRLNVRLDPAP